MALARAIARLADDAALRQRMGMSGRHRAETEFAQSLIVQQTLSTYEAMMLDNRAGSASR